VTYCTRCAARLPGPPPTTCAACGYQLFSNARPTGSVIIVEGDRFLAIRRVREPNPGWWDLPGGFCDGRELPADAAVREAREELSVEVELLEFAGMYLGDYLFQGETLPVLDCFWVARIKSGEIALDPTEASELTWADLADPPPMAFHTMDAVLKDLKSARLIG
jgi:8-oxo-dGTP diphosphatase